MPEFSSKYFSMLCSIFSKRLPSLFICGAFYTGIGIIALGAGGCNHAPETDKGFFNGTSLRGWSAADTSYWSVIDGAIVGHSAHEVKQHDFLWSDTEVTDFYLSVDVKLEPTDGNAGTRWQNPSPRFRPYPAGVARLHRRAIASCWKGVRLPS